MKGGEDEKEQEVKFCRFFDKRVKPTILEGSKEKRTDMRDEQEFTENFGSTSVGKWDKKFERLEEIDNNHKKQLNRAREHHDLGRTTRLTQKSNITMPPEQENRNWLIRIERMEKRMTTIIANELDKHPCEKK